MFVGVGRGQEIIVGVFCLVFLIYERERELPPTPYCICEWWCRCPWKVRRRDGESSCAVGLDSSLINNSKAEL